MQPFPAAAALYRLAILLLGLASSGCGPGKAPGSAPACPEESAGTDPGGPGSACDIGSRPAAHSCPPGYCAEQGPTPVFVDGQWECPEPWNPPFEDRCGSGYGWDCGPAGRCEGLSITGTCGICAYKPYCQGQTAATLEVDAPFLSMPLAATGAAFTVLLKDADGQALCKAVRLTVVDEDSSVVDLDAQTGFKDLFDTRRDGIRTEVTGLFYTGAVFGLVPKRVGLARISVTDGERSAVVAVSVTRCGDSVLQPGEACEGGTASPCPAECPASPCVRTLLEGQACSRRCVLQPITAVVPADGCCAGEGDPDCPATCGDGQVTGDETCDVAIPAGEPGACPATCAGPDPCILAVPAGWGCHRTCRFEAVAAPLAGDGCCFGGMGSAFDPDCPSTCGNGVVEEGEDCDGDCAVRCRDGTPCTADSEAPDGCRCLHEPVTAAIAGDGCCPPGEAGTTDPDCAVCPDLEACVTWTVDLPDPPDALALDGDGRVFVAAGRTLHALSPSGENLWLLEGQTVFPGLPAWASFGDAGLAGLAVAPQGTVYVSWHAADDRDRTFALSPDGIALWAIQAKEFAFVRAMAVGGDGALYQQTEAGLARVDPDGGVHVPYTAKPGVPLTYGDPTLLFDALGHLAYRTEEWIVVGKAGDATFTSPWSHKGGGLLGADNGGNILVWEYSGHLMALKDGKTTWSTAFTDGVRGAVVTDDGTVVVGGVKIRAIDGAGKLLWEFADTALDPDQTEWLIASADGRIYAGAARRIFVLGQSGALLATWSLPGGLSAIPVLSDDGSLYLPQIVEGSGPALRKVRAGTKGLAKSRWARPGRDNQNTFNAEL